VTVTQTTRWSKEGAVVFSLAGEGGNKARVEVTAEPIYDPTGEIWYRIRSTGITVIPGGRVVAGEKEDLRLRKFDLVTDRKTGEKLAEPQAARVVEVIAKPVGAFPRAITAGSTININNHNPIIDSYNSKKSDKSTNGQYDPLKRQSNGDVATNGQFIQAGGSHIFGDLLTNGGTGDTVLNTDNVSGAIRNDFYQEFFPVKVPTTPPDPLTPSAVSGNAEFLATPGAPSHYQLSSLSLSNDETLVIRGAADGSPTYCEIVVTGNISLSGQAAIQLGQGVFVRIFVQGDADISGKGIMNPPNSPQHTPLQFQLYGCDRPANSEGVVSYGSIKISGNAAFSGSIYAPNYNLEMKGGGSQGAFFGAVTAHTVKLTGVTNLHYDEALGDGGLVYDYKIVSWFEDEL
jgi:hypothetical protein